MSLSAEKEKLPSSWKSVRFPKVVRFQEGPGVRNWQFRKEGIKLVNVRNIVDGELVLSNTERHLDPEELRTKYRHFLLDDGDMVLSSSGVTWGKIAEVRKEHLPLCLNTSMIRLSPLDAEGIDKAFLRIFIESRFFRSQILRLITGSAQPNFGPSHLEQIDIPLPPLAEQRRIAEVLDRAEALRAKRRAALTQLDSLTQSLFLDLFGDPATNPKGWMLLPLPSVIYFQEGPGVRNWQFRKEGIKLVNVGNIVDGRLVTENTERHLDPLEVEQRYKHFLLDAGDFVVASSGVTWGKIAEVEVHHLPLCLNTSMIRFRPLDGNVEKQFIRSFVESPAFRRQIARLITGSAQPNFGPAHLKQVRIPLPPIDLQREFARRVTAVETLKTAHRASLAELDALFATLQHRAFRGEL